MLVEATKTRVFSCSREVSEVGGVMWVRNRRVTVNAGQFCGVCRNLRLN